MITLSSLVGALAVGSGASAYFAHSGSGSATSHVGGLNSPDTLSATPNGVGQVDVTWHRVTLSDGTTVAQSYYVKRYSGSTLDGYACGTTPGGTHILSSAANGSGDLTCSDTGLSSHGPYTYAIVAVYHTFTNEGDKSNEATVSLSGPLDHFVLSASSSSITAGGTDNLTITAKDSAGRTVDTYTGSHGLTFSGANSVGGNNPTVTNSSGSAIAFGSSTSLDFTAGVASPASGSNGVATLYKAETASLVVSDGTHTSGTGVSVTVGVGSSNKLGFVQQPTDTAAAATITPAVTVAILDQYGNRTASTANVTVAPSAQTLSGTTTKAAVAGLATFNNLSMTTAGSYTLGATSSGLTGATSSSFNINPGAANKLVWTTQPQSATSQATIGGPPAVTVQDANGNTVTSSSASVTMAISTNPGSGTLSGTKTVSASSGVATWSDLSIDKAGTGYKLTASASGLTSTPASSAFNITAGTASKLVVSAADTTPTAGAGDNLTITAQDAAGNTATSYTGNHNLTFGGASNSPSGAHPTVSDRLGTATAFGTATSVTFSSGVASVSGSNNGQMVLPKAESFNLTVSDGTLTNGTGLAITVGIGTATHWAWENATSSAGTIGSPCLFTCSVTSLGNSGTFSANVAVTDDFGNIQQNLGSGHSVTISITSGGGSMSGNTALAIPSTGAAQTATKFTYTAPSSGSFTSNLSAARSGTGQANYTAATATLSR